MEKIIAQVKNFWDTYKSELVALHYESAKVNDYGKFGHQIEFNPRSELDPWVLVDFDPTENKYYLFENMEGEKENSTNQRFYGCFKKLGNALNSVLKGNSLTDRDFIQW